jgi:hypothetical protein
MKSQFISNFTDCLKSFKGVLIRQIHNTRAMILWRYQKMYPGPGIYIGKDNYIRVLIEYFGRRLMLDNFAKDA